MKDRNDKKNLFIIVGVIVVCGIVMASYTFDFKKSITKKQKAIVNNNYTQKTKHIKLKDIKEKIKTGAVKKINDESCVYSIIDENSFICTDGKALYIKNLKNNAKEQINNCTEGTNESFVGTYKDNIIYTLRENETYNNKGYEIIKLLIYNKTNKKSEIIRESVIDKDAGKGGCYKFQFNGCIKLSENNIFYEAETSEKNDADKIYAYDIDRKEEKIIYSEENKDNCINTFDVDINNGYVICVFYDSKRNEYIKLVNLKDKRTKILAKSQNDINVVINYPNVVFNLENKIHIYNITKEDDDGLIECKDNIKQMTLNNDKLLVKSNNIYSYSLKDKKAYKLGYPDDFNKKYSGIDIMDGKLSWYDGKSINYMDVEE